MLEIQTLRDIVNTSPSVELLRMRNRDVIVVFLYKTFYRNREPVVYETLRLGLTDYLASINFDADDENDITTFDSYEEKAIKYIERWTDKGFLRNYQTETGEIFYELSSYASKTIDWLLSLKREEFVGTESKFKGLFTQLKELVEFTNEDQTERIRLLEERKLEIEHQIEDLKSGGNAMVYEEYQILPRFRELTQNAKELLSDFKEVEDNFKGITKSIYQKHSEEEITKGEILGYTFDALDKLQKSSQGKSFYAFWDFLMTPSLQDAWDAMVEQLYTSLDEKQMKHDDLFLMNMKKYLYNSAKKVHQANDRMAEKLSRIICESGNVKNKATQKMIQDIQSLLIGLHQQGIRPDVSLQMEDLPTIFLPLERRLTLEKAVEVNYDKVIEIADEDIANAEYADKLFNSRGIDRGALKLRIKETLKKNKGQTTLNEVIAEHGGLEKGLAELFGYFSVLKDFRYHADEEHHDTILFNAEEKKSIVTPEIIIVK